jgi:hypothetical protein
MQKFSSSPIPLAFTHPHTHPHSVFKLKMDKKSKTHLQSHKPTKWITVHYGPRLQRRGFLRFVTFLLSMLIFWPISRFSKIKHTQIANDRLKSKICNDTNDSLPILWDGVYVPIQNTKFAWLPNSHNQTFS